MEEKVLVFDIWGDFAHFRRIETTTSPLTYPFPTGTNISGLVAAIVGLERDSYYERFSHDNFSFGIRILSPIKKARINLTFINTSYGYYLWDIMRKGFVPRTLIPLELVRDPKYRIFLRLEAPLIDIHEKLRKYLERHETVYTPYLGITELISNFEFVGEFGSKLSKVEAEEDIHSILKIDNTGVIPEEGKRYGRETIPLYMDESRRVLEYGEVIYEFNGRSIKINKGSYHDVNGEHVVFL
jgi:CRISPR-associated protein Cas5h